MRIIAPERQIELLGMRLDDLENRLSGATKETLQKNLIKLNQLDRALTRHHPESRLQLLREKVENRSTRMRRAARSGLKYQNQILISQQKRLKNNDIQATLRRGYTILKDDSGTILESAASVEKAQSIVAKMEDGEVELRPKN
jgi:exodeoxyribonuclease VII large subunit